jgi:hypothetical protein
MTQFPAYSGGLAIPSMNTVLEGVENQFWFGKIDQQVWLPDTISGAARDAGNTVTTLLRSGLLLGKITASGLLKEWDPTATDGSEVLYGVLGGMLNAQMNATNQQRYVGFVQVAGNLYSDRIIIPGNATEGIVGDAQEFAVISQLGRRFLFDRHLTSAGCDSLSSFRPRFLTAAEITADAVTVTTADHGRLFLMTGGDGTTTFTLPAAKKGLAFGFAANVAQTITIALASGTLSVPGNSAATGVSLSTGESAMILGVAAGQYQLFGHEATD